MSEPSTVSTLPESTPRRKYLGCRYPICLGDPKSGVTCIGKEVPSLGRPPNLCETLQCSQGLPLSSGVSGPKVLLSGTSRFPVSGPLALRSETPPSIPETGVEKCRRIRSKIRK